MKKDKRTQKERISDSNRAIKRDLKAKARVKSNTIKKELKKDKKIAIERKFQEHMARLQGELGV